MSSNIFVIDYGIGNLHSVEKAVSYLNAGARVIDKPEGIESARGLILPGVGAFGDGMRLLGERGFVEPLKRYARSGRPLLGICLGMQFLFSHSEEFGAHRGLDLIGGRVVRIGPKKIEDGFNYKVPHIGWNRLILPPEFKPSWENTILDGISENEELYFVHSFTALPDDSSTVLAYTEYGGNLIVAAVKNGNIYGCQFHPEKSRQTGIRILQNFVNIASNYKDAYAISR